MKKICVFGGTSSLGQVAIEALTSKDWNVRAFSRVSHLNEEDRVCWLKLPCDLEEKIEFCFYLAPIKTFPDYFEMVQKLGVRSIVLISSTSRFTKQKSSQVSERALAQKLELSEEIIQKWALQNHINCVILRPTLIYGGKNNRNIMEISRVINRLGFFPLVGAAHGLRQPIHVEDLASACLTLVEKNFKGVSTYNLSGGEVLSYTEMVARVFKAMNRPVRFLSIPTTLFRLAIRVLRFIPRWRYLNPNMADRMNFDMIFDHDAAKRDFGFNPRPFILTLDDVES